MGENNNVPYIVHEEAMARLERSIKRLWILCVIIFIAFVASNGAWLWYESQWEVYETQEVTQDLRTTGGGDAILSGDVNINGTSDKNN